MSQEGYYETGKGSRNFRGEESNSGSVNQKSGENIRYSIESEELSSEQRKNILSNGSGKWNNGKGPGRPAEKLGGSTNIYRESCSPAFKRREYYRTFKASGKIEQKVIHKNPCESYQKKRKH